MKTWHVVGIVAWALLVGAGLTKLWAYSATPGSMGAAPALWPTSSSIPSQSGRPTLVMFVHPRCPCSRASLSELRKIVERTRGRAATSVMFMKPIGAADQWERTEYWEIAQSIPGVAVLVDTAGAEAARFGAQTSGDVVLYDAHGRRVFHGGITASRGHVGDNSGQLAVTHLINGTAPHVISRSRAAVDSGPTDHADHLDHSDHPVYGCGFHELQPDPTT